MTVAWDRLARSYRFQEWLERPGWDALVALARPDPTDVVADLGCGPGTAARMLARRGRHVAGLAGVDTSPAMLSRARDAGMAVVRGDVRDVPLPDATADLVVCGWVLHLLDQDGRRAALVEVARLVGAHGRGVVLVPGRPPGRAGRLVRGLLRATVASRTLARVHALDDDVAAAGLEVIVDRTVGSGTWGYVTRVLVVRAT